MRKLTILFLTLAMTISIIGVNSVNINTAQATANINIGDYVVLGKYYDEPILWRCVDVDDNGILMLSDKILSIKPFDAKGDHKYLDGYAQADCVDHNNRTNFGSNLWETSNIRSWLNSAATAGNVTWLDGCPPTAYKVYNGYNDYSTEKGFLSDDNFTTTEKQAIKSVTQKSLLNAFDVTQLSTGGMETHNYYDSISGIVGNYDIAYYHDVTDKIFLLDVKQLNKVFQNSSLLGANYYRGKPTQKAVDNSEVKSSTDTYLVNWTRSPNSSSIYNNRVRIVYNDGRIIDDYAFGSTYGSAVGVRPAFYINLSSVDFKSGDGSVETPYIADTCYVVSSTIPSNAIIDENTITANVANTIKILTVDITTSANTTWKLYSDIDCKTEIINKIMKLDVGDNNAYIKITTEDGTTSKVYKVTLTRDGIMANNVAAKHGDKSKIDFHVVGAKQSNYFEFTAVYSNDSLEIKTTDANSDGVYDAIDTGDFQALSHTPILMDSQDPTKRRITIAVQYDVISGCPTTDQLVKLCSINFDVKNTAPIGSTKVEILDNTADQQPNCYGSNKDGNVVVLDNPKAGSVNVITSIFITGASKITVNRQVAEYIAQILPDYTTKDVAWSVSNTTVASIDQSGELTPIINGTVDVIATATDGSGIISQKSVTITGQKSFLTALTATSGIMAAQFSPYTTIYNIYVPQNATAISIKPTFTNGILKNNGMLWGNNLSKQFTLTGTKTVMKLDLAQTNLDAVTYTINVIKAADGIIADNISIYNDSQKFVTIPEEGGQYTVKTTYVNNSATENSAYYIVVVKSDNRLIDVKIVPKTFEPSEELYTFGCALTLPSKDICSNLEIKTILWKDLNNLIPCSLPLGISR